MAKSTKKGWRQLEPWTVAKNAAYWPGLILSSGVLLATLALGLGSDTLAWRTTWRLGPAVYECQAAERGFTLSRRLDQSPHRLQISRYQWAGFLWHYGTTSQWRPHNPSSGTTPSVFYWRLGLPFWFVTLAALIWPLHGLLSLRRWRRRHRRRRGRCQQCGYDLRMTAGPCPECGH
jgi:hypothetical protein